MFKKLFKKMLVEILIVGLAHDKAISHMIRPFQLSPCPLLYFAKSSTFGPRKKVRGKNCIYREIVWHVVGDDKRPTTKLLICAFRALPCIPDA